MLQKIRIITATERSVGIDEHHARRKLKKKRKIAASNERGDRQMPHVSQAQKTKNYCRCMRCARRSSMPTRVPCSKQRGASSPIKSNRCNRNTRVRSTQRHARRRLKKNDTAIPSHERPRIGRVHAPYARTPRETPRIGRVHTSYARPMYTEGMVCHADTTRDAAHRTRTRVLCAVSRVVSAYRARVRVVTAHRAHVRVLCAFSRVGVRT